MSKLTLIIAVVALGLGAWTAYESCEREARMTELEDGVRDVQDAVTDLDGKLDRVLASAGAGDATLMTAEGEARVGSADTSTEAGLATRRPATPGERLAALEERVAEQRDTIAKLEKQANEAPMAPAVASRLLSPHKFYGSLNMAAKAMKLSERQKADMQDVIDVAKRELSDLYETENDDGETWNQVRRGKMMKVGAETGGFSISMPDFKKINAFKKSRVPGTAETFGEAEKRIKDRAFADMRRGLTPEQTNKWDEARKDPLLGTHGAGGVVMSTFTTEVATDEK